MENFWLEGMIRDKFDLGKMLIASGKVMGMNAAGIVINIGFALGLALGTVALLLL